MKKKYISILVFLFSLNYCMYSQPQGQCDTCFYQYSAHATFLQWQYVHATAYECTPIFGTENPAGLSDIYAVITNGIVSEGAGTIFQGLDLMSDYQDCLRNLEEQFFRGLDALVQTLDNCLRYNGCGWMVY